MRAAVTATRVWVQGPYVRVWCKKCVRAAGVWLAALSCVRSRPLNGHGRRFTKRVLGRTCTSTSAFVRTCKSWQISAGKVGVTTRLAVSASASGTVGAKCGEETREFKGIKYRVCKYRSSTVDHVCSGCVGAKAPPDTRARRVHVRGPRAGTSLVHGILI